MEKTESQSKIYPTEKKIWNTIMQRSQNKQQKLEKPKQSYKISRRLSHGQPCLNIKGIF